MFSSQWHRLGEDAARHIYCYPALDTKRGRPSRWKPEDLLKVSAQLTDILERETTFKNPISWIERDIFNGVKDACLQFWIIALRRTRAMPDLSLPPLGFDACI
jgi:hypothetical protein